MTTIFILIPSKSIGEEKNSDIITSDKQIISASQKDIPEDCSFWEKRIRIILIILKRFTIMEKSNYMKNAIFSF